MTRINTNLNSLTAQLNLQSAQNSLQQALTRLSTGLQINSGKDNPGGLIASQVLGSEITSVNASITNSQQADNMIATADAALAQVSSLLNDVRGLVQQSANKGAVSSDQIAAFQVQVDSDLNSITRIGQTTVFGNSYLLNGSKAFNISGNVSHVFNSTTDVQVNSFDPNAAQAGSANDVTVNVTQGATQAQTTIFGNSQNLGGSSSLLNLSTGTSTRTTTTVLGSALNSLSTDSTQATRVITAAHLASLASADDASGDGTVTLQVTGVLNGSATSATTVGTFNVSSLTSSNNASGSGWTGSNAIASAINTLTSTTGVHASVNNSTGDITINSTTNGSSGAVNLVASAATGSKSTLVVGSGTLGSLADATGTDTIAFDIGNGSTTTLSATVSALKAGGIGALFTGTSGTLSNGVTYNVTGSGASTSVTLTNNVVGTTPITIAKNAGGTSDATAGDVTGGGSIVGLVVSGAVSTTGKTANTVKSDFNGYVGSQTNGTDSTNSTQFTITGNVGSATIDLGQLAVGGSKGNDVLLNYNASASNLGLNALAALINTRTGSTGVTATVSNHNLVLTSGGVGSTSLAGFAYASGSTTADSGGSPADQTLLATTGNVTTATGVDGTSNTLTLQITGNKGSATITVDNNAVINDSSALSDAINRVTAQTGVTASTAGGNLANITLKSQGYGSGATLTISAISSTVGADATLFNSTSTQVSQAGKDVAGTVSTGLGTGSFTGTGAQINYTDSAISFDANTDPTVSVPTAATTTIVSTSGLSGAGLNHLTGTGSDTITFHLTGTLGGVATSNNITVNVAQLKADKNTLVDAINALTPSSGVTAALTGGNVVLTSTTAGTSGSVAITATAATQAGDVTIFNAAGSQTSTTPGLNAPASATASFDVSGGALFQIGPTVNYQNQVTANITALDLNTLGRNVLTTGQTTLADLLTGGSNTLSTNDLSTAASVVDQAISQIATLRGKLGALQKNVLESNITSEQATLEQLTKTQSDIQDANFAQETANLTRAQILTQAGTSVLAIANSQPQQILALLPHG